MNEFERRALDIAQSSFYLAAYARKNKKIVAFDYFAYNVAIPAIAVGATGQGLIQIQSDSDFILTYMSGSLIVANSVVTDPYATAQITDTGSGKTLFSEPALFPLVFGRQGFPFLLPAPRLFAPNTNIQFNITNVALAGAADAFISMNGVRVYYAS